jgi:hypothetical protein
MAKNIRRKTYSLWFSELSQLGDRNRTGIVVGLTMTIITLFTLGLHALIAWVVMEVYVNNAYRFSRPWYVLFHYGAVVFVFGTIFSLFFRFHPDASVFWTTVLAIGYVISIELIVFRYLYIGERWFLNFVDWIFPIFLAASTIYAVGVFF